MSDDKPFHLQGNFAPIEAELTTLEPEVVGSIPRDLQGLYVRNGANPVTGKSEHWFLGDGMVHGVYFRDGEVTQKVASHPPDGKEDDINSSDPPKRSNAT